MKCILSLIYIYLFFIIFKAKKSPKRLNQSMLFQRINQKFVLLIKRHHVRHRSICWYTSRRKNIICHLCPAIHFSHCLRKWIAHPIMISQIQPDMMGPSLMSNNVVYNKYNTVIYKLLQLKI